MRILAVSDLHYTLPQFDWLVRVAPRYDLVIVAGDLLEGSSLVTTSAQMVVVLKYLERLRGVTRLMVCSGNHDLNHAYSTGERYARSRLYQTSSSSYENINSAIYLEDSWQITDTFLAYLGMRWEKFESLNAHATAGGIDQAKLYDSAGNDYFDAGPHSAVLRGSSFYTYVERFEKVFGYAQWGGHDIAKLYGQGMTRGAVVWRKGMVEWRPLLVTPARVA